MSTASVAGGARVGRGASIILGGLTLGAWVARVRRPRGGRRWHRRVRGGVDRDDGGDDAAVGGTVPPPLPPGGRRRRRRPTSVAEASHYASDLWPRGCRRTPARGLDRSPEGVRCSNASLIASERASWQTMSLRRPPWWPTEGDEPDPRWTLANERTLLAYERTALGLLVAGLAVAGSRAVADAPPWLSAMGPTSDRPRRGSRAGGTSTLREGTKGDADRAATRRSSRGGIPALGHRRRCDGGLGRCARRTRVRRLKSSPARSACCLVQVS